MQRQKIKKALLSNKKLDTILALGRWDERGSSLEYFFNDYIEELMGNRDRRTLLKEYIEDKIESVFDDIEQEKAEKLYRAMYLKDPVIDGFPGIYWSSRENTTPYVEKPDGFFEVVLSMPFSESLIDWEETVLARLDYLFGDSEKEYRLKDGCLISNIELSSQ